MALVRLSKQGPWALVCLVLLVAVSGWAAPVFPSLTGRVVDNANLLDTATEGLLTEASAALERKTSVQFVVVTVPGLQGYDIADFGYQLGRTWGIGQKGKDNGLLLIVAPNERKVRVEVGYGLEGVVTDARASGVIQQVILPQFKAGDMQGGIVAGSNALVQLVGGDVAGFEQAIQPKSEPLGLGGIWMVLILIGYFLLALRYPRLFILLQILGSLGGGGGRGGGGFRVGGGGFGGGGASGGW